MKKFLCYDTEAAARGEINVDSRGMLKPTTPSAQADWNENDSSSPAYILNKPENLGGGGSDSVVGSRFQVQIFLRHMILVIGKLVESGKRKMRTRHQKTS